jgi:hypothetical protein
MGVYIQVSEHIKQPYGQKIATEYGEENPNPLREGESLVL